jgi:hypothetical protein
MLGTKRIGVVLQDRDRDLLKELGVLRIIDRETAKVVAGFKSTRRANCRLLQLTRAGLLRRFFVGSIAHGRKAVYTLSAKGANITSAHFAGIHRPSSRLVVGDRFVEHQSGINEVYLAVKYFPAPDVRLGRWLTFSRSLSEAIKLTPDGYFDLQRSGGAVQAAFLEVDLGTEALQVWQQKIAYYLQLALSGDFQKRFHQPQFRVLVVCNSERRLHNLRTAIAKQTDKIFWFSTFALIQRSDFWSPVWLRPTGAQRHAL